MSEWTVGGAIIMDTSDAFMKIKELQDAIDQQAREWAIQRNTLLRQIREGFTLISSLMSSFRQAMSLFGAQIDPYYSALIGMVLSTTSMLLSAATTLALTGIGGVAAAIILGLAISFNILTVAKLTADKRASDSSFGMISAELRDLQRRSPPRFSGAGF